MARAFRWANGSRVAVGNGGRADSGGSGCIRTMSPARNFDAYEHKAKDTAESALSAVETARLGARRCHATVMRWSVRLGALLGSRGRRVQAARDLRQRATARRPFGPDPASTRRVAHANGRSPVRAAHRGTAERARSAFSSGRAARATVPQARPLHLEPRMKKFLGVTLGILTAIGGFVDIGDLVANAADRRPLRHVAGVGRRRRCRRHHRVRRDVRAGSPRCPAGRCSTSSASASGPVRRSPTSARRSSSTS